MNNFLRHQINKTLPSNMEYEMIDDESRRKRYAKLDRKRKLIRKCILGFCVLAIATIYALAVGIVIHYVLCNIGGC